MKTWRKGLQLALGMILLLGLAGCGTGLENGTQGQAEEVSLQLFTPHPSSLRLEAREAVFSDDDQLFFHALQQVGGDSVLRAWVDGGTAWIDLDSSLQLEGQAQQILYLYALVNTAGEFSGVEEVRFLQDGQLPPVDTHWMVDLSAPYRPEPTMVEEGWYGIPLHVYPEAPVTPLLVENLPSHFRAAGWLNQGRLLGLSGGQPYLYNVEEGKGEGLAVQAWNLLPAPDGDRFAYTNEEGLFIYFVDGDKGSTGPLPIPKTGDDPDLGDSQLGAVAWSPAHDRLLVAVEYEWDANYYVYDLEEGEYLPLLTRLDGYFLTSFGAWLTEDLLLFNTRASINKDGTREYGFGYRSNLALADLKRDSFQLVTDADDGVFLETEGLLPDGEVLVREHNGVGQEVRFGILDLGEGELEYSSWPEDIYSLHPGPGQLKVAVTQGYRTSFNERQEAYLVLGEEMLPWLRLWYGDSSPRYLWSDDGQLVLDFSSHFPVDDQASSFTTKNFTWLLTFE